MELGRARWTPTNLEVAFGASIRLATREGGADDLCNGVTTRGARELVLVGLLDEALRSILPAGGVAFELDRHGGRAGGRWRGTQRGESEEFEMCAG